MQKLTTSLKTEQKQMQVSVNSFKERKKLKISEEQFAQVVYWHRHFLWLVAWIRDNKISKELVNLRTWRTYAQLR